MKIDELLTILRDNPVPILFMDTCAVLDILRLPYRSKTADYAKDILKAMNAFFALRYDQKIHFIVSDIVTQEFHNNHSNVENELYQHLHRLKLSYDIHMSLVTLLDVSNGSQAFNPLTITDLLKSYCERLLSQETFNLDCTPELKLAAANRSISGTPPAKQGKGSINDCIVYETLIATAKSIRNLDTNLRIGFISSNTEDFGNAKCLPVNIKNDFLQFGISFFNTWNHAFFDLCGKS